MRSLVLQGRARDEEAVRGLEHAHGLGELRGLVLQAVRLGRKREREGVCVLCGGMAIECECVCVC